MAYKKKEILTGKQKLFCQHYLDSYNATQSYIKAYGAKYNTARVSGPKLLSNIAIIKEIKKLKKESKNKIMIEKIDIINQLIKIAFSDMGNYARWYNKEEEAFDGFGNALIDSKGNRMKIIKNYVKIIESDKVDTSLIEEISNGKNGFKIKLKDSKYAMDYLIKYFDLFPDEWKRKIEEKKLEILKSNSNFDENKPDINFIDDIAEDEN